MPAVIDAMTNYRAQLDAQGTEQAARLASSWLNVTRGLDAEFERLAQEMADRRAQGLPVSLWHIRRMERYQSLMRQTNAQLAAFGPEVVGDVTRQQALMVRWGLEHSQTLIITQANSIALQFDRLPVEAFVNMVGNTGAGTPLGTLLAPLPGEGAAQVTQALVRGVALGWHPSKTARAMRDGANIAYNRAILIARSEQLRIYRESSRQQYEASGVIAGYRRVAAKSIRTCIGCLFSDGQFYELSVPFEEHPDGRCQAVPMLKRTQAYGVETGEQWFRRQDAATQRAMMGPGRYTAWRAGRFDLADTVQRRDDPTWGASLVPKPLQELMAT